MPKHAPDLTGQRFGRLVAMRRADVRVNDGAAWLCRCDCGRWSNVKGLRLRRGTTRSCGCLQAQIRRRPNTDQPKYMAAHARVWAAKGAAADQRCIDCGGRAQQWSYDHEDPNEFRRPDGAPYSGDPVHYDARCIPCHRRFDALHRATLPALEGAR